LQHSHLPVPEFDDAATVFPTRGTIRVGYFWGLDTLVRKLGGDPLDILAQRGLDARIFDDPDNTIDCMAAIDLMEYCSSTLRDPLFGLHLAAIQEPGVFGCVIALAQAAPTFRQALQCLVDFIPVSASPECELELVVKGDTAKLRWRSHIGLGDEVQTYYHGLFIVHKALELIGRQHFRPSSATLNCAVGRADFEALSGHLGYPVIGRAEHNAIAFSSDRLESPLPTSNRLSYSILQLGLANLHKATRGNYVDNLRACVRRGLSTGHCTVGSCARDLHTSTRTLQKRLKRLGYKFSDIVREERIKMARHALTCSDYSLDEIAFQLGYAEQTSFGRAFKSATGFTPKAFRLAQRQ